MGLLDGVLQFLEEKMFKRMEEQFKELIAVIREMDKKLEILINIQKEKG